MKLEKFDYQINDNKKNRSVVVLGVLVAVLLAGFIIYRSFAAYKVTETYNIIKGSVAEFTQEKLKIAYNLVGEDGEMMSTSEIPSSKEYEYDALASKCENGTEIVYNKETNTIIIDENAEDICNIYFNYIPLSKQTLYALGFTLDDIKEGIPYGPDGTGVDGFYAAEDNYGISYYYYAKNDMAPFVWFGEHTWLVLRINGDGSLRMVNYDYYETMNYNEKSDDNAYVGYMFGKVGSENLLETHFNENDSIMKIFLNDYFWPIYEPYSSMISDTYFCNDRSLYKEEYGEKEADDTALGTGQNVTYYGAYYRLKNNTPSLKCDKKDAFTVNESEIGNGNGGVPLGLLTADELLMTNIGGYLPYAFTMTPAMFKENVAYNYRYADSIVPRKVDDLFVATPVINLRHGLTYTGDPSWYEVSE